MDAYLESYVSGGFAAIFRLARFAGLAPLNFAKNKDGWSISASFGWSLYGYIMIITLNGLTFASLIIQVQSDQLRALLGWSKTRYTVWAAQDALTMISSVVAVLKAPAHMQLLLALLNRVQKINDELNVNGWPKSLERKMSGAIIAQLAVAVIWALTEFIWRMTTYWKHNINIEASVSGSILFYFMCYWILELRNVQFIVFVLHVKYSFKKINDHLKSLLHELGQSNFDVIKKFSMQNKFVDHYYLDNMQVQDAGKITTKYKIQVTSNTPQHFGSRPSKSRKHQGTVRRLLRLYACLCNVVQDMDQVNGAMVLLLIVSYMLQLICTAYHLVYNCSIAAVPDLPQLFITLVWFFIHAFCLAMTIEPCHLMHMEMAQTRELVGHLISSTQSILYDPLDAELEQFFRHLVLNDASYMPLNITTMSRALLLTILGSVTTYTVVILHI